LRFDGGASRGPSGWGIGKKAVETILSFDGTICRETLDVELVVRGSTARSGTA